MPHPSLRLTPHAHLVFEDASDAPELDARIAGRLADAFSLGSGEGLLRLGAGEVGQALPPLFLWWRGFATRYVAALCLQPSAEVAPPTDAELASLVLTAPMMPGAEYLTTDVLRMLWQETATALATSLAAAKTDLQSFLKGLNPAWNLVGRVHFNLAENRGDADAPFAFLATYTTQLTAQARAQHVALGQALREYAGAANREKLLSLLLPVRRATETCSWLQPMLDTGELYHPLRWTPREAARLLASVPDLEHAGVVVRMPPTWRANRPPRPQVTGTVGARKPSALGLEGVLDFHMDVTLDGETLSAKETAALLAGTDSLVLLRGQWVEIDRERLERSIRQFREAEQLAEREGLSFAAAMRMLAGAAVDDAVSDVAVADWSRVTAGPWLADTLQQLRSPDGAGADPNPALRGTLRLYQRAGVQWLQLLSGLGLGACLADDMGLGKTIQVLALLLAQRGRPSLLVAPASLLANWTVEVEKFAPDLKVAIVHPSAMTAEQVGAFTATAAAAETDLQPPLAVAARSGLGGGGKRQTGSPARDRRGGGVAPGKDAGVHPIPRDDRAACDVPGQGVRPPRPGAARETAVKGRRDLVRTFQEDETVPFFVLSLKAGGSGLTLTAASHVVHFDRWWNPAVENQATDRAFRIGQKRNVLVHKFVCRGTVEEKIDRLIESKQGVSDELLSGGGEVNLTEMKDDDLLRLVALDLHAAMREVAERRRRAVFAMGKLAKKGVP